MLPAFRRLLRPILVTQIPLAVHLHLEYYYNRHVVFVLGSDFAATRGSTVTRNIALAGRPFRPNDVFGGSFGYPRAASGI